MREISQQEITYVTGGSFLGSLFNGSSNAATPPTTTSAAKGFQIGYNIGSFIDNAYTKLTGHAAFNEATSIGLVGYGIGSFFDTPRNLSLSINAIYQGIGGIVSGISQGISSLFKA